MILVDTRVLLDVLQDDPIWAEWSVAALEGTASRAPHFDLAAKAFLAYRARGGAK